MVNFELDISAAQLEGYSARKASCRATFRPAESSAEQPASFGRSGMQFAWSRLALLTAGVDSHRHTRRWDFAVAGSFFESSVSKVGRVSQ